MGVFDDDFAAADDMLAEVFGGAVSIHRGSISTSDVMAEAVSRDYEVIDSEGFLTTVHSRDFVINVADYQLQSTVQDPLAGDVIKETIDGTVHKWQVLPIGTRPAREWVANQKPQWLIHTKLIGTE